MSTTRTRSALLTWGAVLFSSVLVVTACTGDPVATGTVPVTSSVVSRSDVSSSQLTPFQSLSTSASLNENETTSTLTTVSDVDPTTGPVLVTVQTTQFAAPEVITEPSLDVPAGASQQTVGGATDFIQWWYALGSASAKNKTITELETFRGDNCIECAEQIYNVKAYISAGDQEYKETDTPWLTVIQAGEIENEVVTVVAIVHAPSTKIEDRQQTIIQESGARDFITAINIRWDAERNHWTMDGYREIAR